MTDAPTLMGEDEMADPSVTARRLHASGGVFRFDGFEPPFYIVSRYDDVERVLRQPDVFLSGHGQGPNFAPPVGVVSDAPEHTFFRQLVQPNFQARTVAGLRGRLEEIAVQLLADIPDRRRWDLHDALAFPLPVIIICEILGVPAEDIDRFKHWSDASVAALASQNPNTFAADREAMSRYLLQILKRKRRDPADGSLLSAIAHAHWQGEPVNDEEAVALVQQIFVAGNETTTSLITNFVWRFLQNEGMWQRLCEGGIDLERAINESLRFDPPLLGMFRTTARQVRIDGCSVPEHSKIMMHFGAANRDEGVFTDPHVFDPEVHRRKSLSFGLGIHVCLGRELALLEARVAIEALMRQAPDLGLLGDGERIGPFLFWGRRKLPVCG